jgi:hypothetical protein
LSVAASGGSWRAKPRLPCHQDQNVHCVDGCPASDCP